jgi:CBS domain containing-hemolysin-like protein
MKWLTLEDIIEEILGTEIEDETDGPQNSYDHIMQNAIENRDIGLSLYYVNSLICNIIILCIQILRG